MKNTSLIKDYFQRGQARFKALKVLFDENSYADVVRESQEIVELISKACIRFLGAEPARVHDVSAQLEELKPRLATKKKSDIDILIKISRDLRRDRELAFYGTEDLTPSEFYSKEDAIKAISQAEEALKIVAGIIL